MNDNVNCSKILYTKKTSFIGIKATDLAKEYALPLKWIKRGLEVSKRLKINPDFFISKYILEKNMPQKIEFEKIFLELLKEDQSIKDNTI